MGWQFWRSESGATAVDADLRDLIMGRFSWTAVDIDKLSVLRRVGKFAGRPVVRLRVFDPSLLDRELGEVNTYEHLDTQPQAVCFEGHAEKGRPIDNLNAKGCIEEAPTTA